MCQGYWISAVDPWPQYWGDNWYENDNVYVDYVDNGYYLITVAIPEAELRSTSRSNGAPVQCLERCPSRCMIRSYTCLERS